MLYHTIYDVPEENKECDIHVKHSHENTNIQVNIFSMQRESISESKKNSPYCMLYTTG